MKVVKTLALLVLGFFLYPLVFVPVMNIWFPDALEWWIHRYAEYLRLWGF